MRPPLHALVGALLALLPSPLIAQPDEGRELLRELHALTKDFEGTVGLRVVHPGREIAIGIREDELFPTASLIKVPILGALMERVENGELEWSQKLEYEPKWSRGGEDLLAMCRPGSKIALSKLVMLMESFSDNTASVWCQDLAGGGEVINRWLEKSGFERTRVNSRTEGRTTYYERYGWGQTTPREMVEMLLAIRDRKLVSRKASERMHRALCRSYWDGEALSVIPPRVQVASKQGAVSRSRSEVLLVHAPEGDYAFCVMTKEQKDRSWGDDNAGFVLLRKVSEMLWKRFGAR